MQCGPMGLVFLTVPFIFSWIGSTGPSRDDDEDEKRVFFASKKCRRPIFTGKEDRERERERSKGAHE